MPGKDKEGPLSPDVAWHTDDDVTLTADLPDLHLEIRHRRHKDREAETLTLTATALPGFAALMPRYFAPDILFGPALAPLLASGMAGPAAFLKRPEAEHFPISPVAFWSEWMAASMQMGWQMALAPWSAWAGHSRTPSEE